MNADAEQEIEKLKKQVFYLGIAVILLAIGALF